MQNFITIYIIPYIKKMSICCEKKYKFHKTYIMSLNLSFVFFKKLFSQNLKTIVYTMIKVR